MTNYATVAQFKAQTGLVSSGDDVAINDILAGVSRLIDRVCNRPDGFVASSTASYRYFVGSGKPVMRIDECVSVSGVAVKESPTDATYTDWKTPTSNLSGDGDWYAASGNPDAPELNHTPYTLLVVDPAGSYSVFTDGRYSSGHPVPTVRVYAKWGYATTVPDDIRDATIMVAARWYKLYHSFMARVSATGEIGTVNYPSQLDPDAYGILAQGGYIRPRVGRK